MGIERPAIRREVELPLAHLTVRFRETECGFRSFAIFASRAGDVPGETVIASASVDLDGLAVELRALADAADEFCGEGGP